MGFVQLSAIPDVVPDMAVKTRQPKPAPKPKSFAGRERVLTVLHLGAGRQSSTIAEMIVTGDLPPVELVVFADTGAEPFWVYQQVEYLTKRLKSVGIPLETVRKAGGLTIITAAKQSDSRFASMPLFTLSRDSVKRRGQLRRQCTTEWKVNPSTDRVLDLLLEQGHARINTRGARRVSTKVFVEDWYGISADEPWRLGERGQNWRKTVYPLAELKMTVAACVAWLTARGLPVPRKSSCKVCPYHSDEYWLEMQTTAPAEFAEAADYDDWLRSPEARAIPQLKGLREDCFLHNSCVPLRSIDFAALIEARRGPQLEGFDLKRELIDGAACSTDGGFSCFS